MKKIHNRPFISERTLSIKMISSSESSLLQYWIKNTRLMIWLTIPYPHRRKPRIPLNVSSRSITLMIYPFIPAIRRAAQATTMIFPSSPALANMDNGQNGPNKIAKTK